MTRALRTMWAGLVAFTVPLLLLAGPADPAPTVQAPRCVGRWALDEGDEAAIADASGNESHGAIAADMRGVRWVEGRTGMALAFSGNQKTRGENGCVVIPGLGACDFSRGITVEAWIMPSKTVQRAGCYEIVSSTVSDRGTGFRLVLSWDALRFFSGEGGDGKTWGAQSNPAQVQIAPDVWHHVAGTYDGSVFRIYLDGEEVGTSEPGLTLTRGPSELCIGAYRGGYAYGFEGMIDDVAVYDGALSPLTIIRHAKLSQ